MKTSPSCLQWHPQWWKFDNRSTASEPVERTTSGSNNSSQPAANRAGLDAPSDQTLELGKAPRVGSTSEVVKCFCAGTIWFDPRRKFRIWKGLTMDVAFSQVPEAAGIWEESSKHATATSTNLRDFSVTFNGDQKDLKSRGAELSIRSSHWQHPNTSKGQQTAQQQRKVHLQEESRHDADCFLISYFLPRPQKSVPHYFIMVQLNPLNMGSEPPLVENNWDKRQLFSTFTSPQFSGVKPQF